MYCSRHTALDFWGASTIPPPTVSAAAHRFLNSPITNAQRHFLHHHRKTTLPSFSSSSSVLTKSERGPLPPSAAPKQQSALARSTKPIIEVDEVPFSVYTPEANSAYWSTRPVAVVKRMMEVSSSLGAWFVMGRLRGVNIPKDERADSLRLILTKLGPTFIKIGQALSSRPDTLPPEFLQELEKLQDKLPPFSTELALQMIEEELGRPVSEVFSSISDFPVAAASLGQVYKAYLKRDGSEVAVKVQRPGVKTSIALDVLVLRQLAGIVRKWRNVNSDLPALIDEWAASLFKELDYCEEAQNGIKFAELYSHLDGVYVPAMVTDLTTTKVLVMEWINGKKLRTAYSAMSSMDGESSPDDLRLVEIGVRCSLEQLLEHGYYHCDPHPGNLLKMENGKLAYLDFGMMGEVDEPIRQGLIRATLHLVNREYESLADDFVSLGMLPKDSDKNEIVPALTSVFAEALAGGVNNLSFGSLSTDLGQTMYKFKFQIPSYYTLLVRSMSVLEGIALASDPNYKVLGAAYPWIARRLLTDQTPELRATLLSLLYKDGKFNFKRMESLLTQAARPTGRPQRRREDPEGSEPPRGDALALILSPQGDFVRGIVVEELSKGADAAWRVAADSLVDGVKGELTVASAAIADPVVTGPLLKTLIDVLAVAPTLAERDDAEQLDGLRRLSRALQAATVAQKEADEQRSSKGGKPSASPTWMPESQPASGGGSSSTGAATDACSSLESAVELLQWALREAETLSPSARNEALKLPLDVAQNVASRVVARAVRWWLNSEDSMPPPASDSSSSSSSSSSESTAAGGGTSSSSSSSRSRTAAAASAPA